MNSKQRNWQPQSPMITAQEFADVATDGLVFAVHFFAYWDNIDKDVDKTLATLTPRLSDRMTVYCCNVDDPANMGWITTLRLLTVPTVGVFVGRQRVHWVVGSRPIRAMYKELLIGWRRANTA